MTWYAKKDFDRALRDFDQALRLNPTFTTALINRGYTHRARREYDRAIEDFDAAIRLNLTFAPAFVNRGLVWYARKDFDRAARDYDEALRLDPTSVYGYGNRAAVRVKQGRYAAAVKDFDEAVRLDPTTGWVQRDYALFRATCLDPAFRDGKKAVVLAARAIELAGANATWEYQAALAAAHAEAGEFDRAVAEQKKALADESLAAEDRPRMEARLRLYEQKRPCRGD
jgi:tetratricopeptide (TPR) repeat protein